MVSIAAGAHFLAGRRRSAACRPTPALLPYWLGAVLDPAARRRWLGAPLAARLPFALLLAADAGC